MSLPARPPPPSRSPLYMPSPHQRGLSPVGSMRGRQNSNWRDREGDVYVPEGYRDPYVVYDKGWQPDERAYRERDERDRERMYYERDRRREYEDRRRDGRQSDYPVRGRDHTPPGYSSRRRSPGPYPPGHRSPQGYPRGHPPPRGPPSRSYRGVRTPSPSPPPRPYSPPHSYGYDRRPSPDRRQGRGRSRSGDRAPRNPPPRSPPRQSPPRRGPSPSPPRRSRPDDDYERRRAPVQVRETQRDPGDRRDRGGDRDRDNGWGSKPPVRDRQPREDMNGTKGRPKEDMGRRAEAEDGEVAARPNRGSSPRSSAHGSTPYTRRTSPARAPSPTARRQADVSPNAVASTSNHRPPVPPSTPPTEPRHHRSNTQQPSAKPTPAGPARRPSVNESGSWGGGPGSGWGDGGGGWGSTSPQAGGWGAPPSPKPKRPEPIVALPPKRPSLTASLDAELAQVQALRAKEAKVYEDLHVEFRQARMKLSTENMELRSAAIRVDMYEQRHERALKGLPMCSEEDMEIALQL